MGAGIRKISAYFPDRAERLLTLSYKEISEYKTNDSLAGRTIGPNSGRLPAKAGIIPGKTAFERIRSRVTCFEDGSLLSNGDELQLHGGPHNLSGINWKVFEIVEERDYCEAVFTTAQENGLDGWSGQRNYRVSYRLTSAGEITISFYADTDRPAYFNLTNHTYWLMEGLSLSVSGEKFCMNDEGFLPVKITAPPYKKNRESGFLEIPCCEILNNGFILSDEKQKVREWNKSPVACLAYPDLCVRLFTDAPALVVYTGDYLDSDAILSDGSVSSPRTAVALEAQEMPSLQNTEPTLPGHPFRRMIRFDFSA